MVNTLYTFLVDLSTKNAKKVKNVEVTCNYDPKKRKKATVPQSGGLKIPKAYFFSSFRVMSLMTSRVPIINTIPMGRQMSQFCTKPAMMKETKETAATVIA